MVMLSLNHHVMLQVVGALLGTSVVVLSFPAFCCFYWWRFSGLSLMWLGVGGFDCLPFWVFFNYFVLLGTTSFRLYPDLIKARFGCCGCARPLLLLFVRVVRCYEALGELFSDEPLYLRVDHRGDQNYRVPFLS